jgi:hypothetical protein
VRRFLERRDHVPVFTAYVAEDIRDDDAFGALDAATAAVGWRAPRADFHLGSTGDVRALLAGLAKRTRDPSGSRRQLQRKDNDRCHTGKPSR